MNAIVQATTAGDDYEIAFTAPASKRADVFEAAARVANTPVAEIGRVEEGSGVSLIDADGRAVPVARSGYTHF